MGTKSSPPSTSRESMAAPRTTTSDPTRVPPVASATSDARSSMASYTRTSVGLTRLVLLFGGRSAEHDVSCVTAAHVLAAADPSRYDVVPVGITHDGRWVRAE